MNKLRSLSLLSILLLALFVAPVFDFLLPEGFSLAEPLPQVFIFALLALGVNVLSGYVGMLNLGSAGFMAVGAYAFSIATCEIYPFQLGFFGGFSVAIFFGMLTGLILGLPTVRLSGDYLAIVTLGFGEIIQSLLKNLDSITKGTQGINPLPAPKIFSYEFSPDFYYPWYYLFLGILSFSMLFLKRLESSRIGRAWTAIREDELASKCMAIDTNRYKLLALLIGAGLSSASGALLASFLGSSGEPGNYDFQISVSALCMVILGGLGQLSGVLLGAIIMIGFNSILLVKLSAFLTAQGLAESGNVYLTPANWKYAVFGLALILALRLRPQGICVRTKEHV